MNVAEAVVTEKICDVPVNRENHHTDDSNEYLVDFDGPKDPENPLHWCSLYKWSVVMVISIMSLVVNLAILMCAPATPSILEEFHSTNHLESTILVSIWELGEVVGPLIIGPLSEIYGRLPVYHTANVLFIIFSAAAAKSQSLAMLIAFRFLLGLTVASTTLNSCIVGDLFAPEKRGRAIAVMGMTPFIAPILGPIVGGFISHAKGWRWTFWLTTIITGAFEISFLLLYRETYRVIILSKKARRLRKQTRNHRLQTPYHTGVSATRLLGQSAFRPIKLLFVSSTILLVSFCGAFASSYTYIIITTLTGVFEETYDFPESLVGLTYLGLGLGMISSVVACGSYLDSHLKRKAASGYPEPEHRLPPMALGTVIIPVGLIIFGWTAQNRVQYIIPIGSTILVGFGFVAVSLASSSYLVDAFGIYAASATAATTVLKNAASAALPLAGPPLFGRLGLGLGATVLGLVALVAAPVPLVLMSAVSIVTGNGGIDGCIKYEDLAYTTQNRFASVGSNNGHNGTTAITMYHNPDVVTDFAWRSLHTITVAGKKLTKIFYQKAYKKSYFLGCSLGGRQGIKAAEMFPGDFDGVVAGSPALDFNNLQSWRASFFPITGPANPSGFISTATWSTVIHDEVLNQCDGLDGAIDGINEDPNLCNFRPEALLCKGNTSTNCLTSTQAEMVREVFSPFYGEGGNLIYPAMQPGSEISAAQKLYAGAPFSYSESWFKYVVYDPSWDAATFNIHDVAVAEALNPSNIRTWPNNLTDFQNKGGKMILFHGGQDNQITSFNTERFYNYFSRGTHATSDELDVFFRFFRVPGMFHCNSGPGGWVIGQGGGASAAGVPFVSANNVLAAVVRWVEKGAAVEDIVGTKFLNDSVNLGVDFRHRHCKYPSRSTYLRGDVKSLSSWKCL